MIRGGKKHEATIAILTLSVAGAISAYVVWEPERDAIINSFYGYLGDIKQHNVKSASRRIFPDDLTGLKMTAMELASEDSVFREELLNFMEVRSAEELGAVSKEVFFEFLLNRTFERHPEVVLALFSGQVVGFKVIRHHDDAVVEARLRVSTQRGKRDFVMTLSMARLDGEWFVRL